MLLRTPVTTVSYCEVPIYLGEAFVKVWEKVPPRTIIITDEHVKALWGHLFEDRPCIVLPPGEEAKSLETVGQVVEELVELGADRGSFLLGVGGGVVCDLTGFIASVFMRGIPFAFAPTTLLAQVDAAIGGKNAVNTDHYKNMIGLFNQPQFILSDPQFLSTLPDHEFSNGLAECIKHACIVDEAYFSWMEQHLDSLHQTDTVLLEKLIIASVRIKCAIVDEDPLEQGTRKLLNYGHTFGHVLEKQHGWSHGKAISVGMNLVNQMAVDRGMLNPDDRLRISELLMRAGLPGDTGGIHCTDLFQAVRSDKKKEDGHIAFVLLKGIGRAEIVRVALDD
ncbi:MAG: 3-dehydroquinate synthase [Flavobacteriales bacterium]|nr:3-dehydroquinate synthase [Flavobacteriales bacterium]